MDYDKLIRMIGFQDIRNILDERKKRDDNLFFLPMNAVFVAEELMVVKRKCHFGLQHTDKKEILPTVFDEIRILYANLVSLKVKDSWALYDCSQNKLISDFEYIKIEKNGIFVELSCYNSKGWYDPVLNRYMARTGYDQINLLEQQTEYLWAKKGKFFDFIHRETGRLVSPSGVIMAYDTPSGMFGLNEHNHVCYYTETGSSSPDKLRDKIIKAGGHMTLQNLTFRIEHVIDVYGNILNK